MSRDQDHPSAKMGRHLRLLPGVAGQPKASAAPAKKPGPAVFVPGRTYRNWRMEIADFVVAKVEMKCGLHQLHGYWVNRRSKLQMGQATHIRINIIEDWKLLPLATHPRVKLDAPLELVREVAEPDPLDGPALSDPLDTA